MFDAIQAVGYGNTVCIDYSAKTDPIGNIEAARDMLAALIEPEEIEDDEEEEAAEAEVEEA
jgi:hypothetical protein